MQAHIVVAHPEPQSFNAHLAALAKNTLNDRGWNVTVSDLYAMGFDPCEKAAHYVDPADASRFDTQSEQRHASATQTIPAVVGQEIDRMAQADLVILQYPMWWHLPPAILKGWMDRVFIYGDVYKSDFRFENGRFVGRKALISVTVGTSPQTYAHNGRSGDIDMMLWPINFSLAYVGFEILAPHVAYGVEAGLRYSDPLAIKQRLAKIETDYVTRLKTIEREASVPFNGMKDWGADGRIKPSAPVYSPFIRHKENLVIE
ncbi:MAG: NAD(P)H-dependent oxidoreductase [Paracoccaceae bacterium]